MTENEKSYSVIGRKMTSSETKSNSVQTEEIMAHYTAPCFKVDHASESPFSVKNPSPP